MTLYSIKNIQTDLFNPPFVSRDDVDAKEIIRKAIIGGRDISLLIELENLELYQVGGFDPVFGSFDDQKGFICSLSDIPLPDHIQGMIDKMKEVKE